MSNTRRKIETPETTTDETEPVAVAMLPTIPERVGKYVLGVAIGGGGMGRVFKAVHVETRAEAAIKIMRTDLATRGSVERFRQEARLLAKVRHTNIALVYDAGTTRVGGVDTPYIAMEYIHGARTIKDYASGLDGQAILKLFIKVCRAVHHLNDRGIVHRDLKPSNILVDSDAEPKIIDFGVAKNLDRRFEETVVITGDGNVPGTVPYMAPEQVTRRHDLVDRRTDVYALGVVLYELICGRLPYRVTGVPPLEAMRAITEEPPTEPTRMKTHEVLGRDLRTILLKMLEKERSRRYQSAEDVARDLERLVAGQAIEATPTSTTYRMKKWLSRGGERSPAVVMVSIWVLATAVAMLIGPWAMYRATGLAASYAGFLLSLSAPTGVGYQHVQVIGIRDVEQALAAAPSLEVAPLNEDQNPATRARLVEGLLLERLAECSPRCVALDIRFVSAQRAEAIVRGARALKARGIETVVGCTSFLPRGYGTANSSGLPDIDESIARVTRWGSISAGKDAGTFGVRLALGAERTGEVFASFGTATWLAAEAPGREYTLSFDGGELVAGLLNGSTGARLQTGETLRLPVTELARHMESDARYGITADDVIADAAVKLPPWAFDESEPSTIDLTKALTMPIADLRRQVLDKVVLIIDLRPGWDEDVSDGKRFHKGYLWATWLDEVLSGRSIRGPGSRDAYEQMITGAFLGAVVFMVPPKKRRRRAAVWLSLVGLAGLASGVVIFNTSSIVFVPMLGLFALLLAGVSAALFPKPIEI